MAEFIRICSTSELPPEGQANEISVGDRVICVANIGGAISAMDNVCIHRGGPLGQGSIENGKIVCPWHGWQWDPKTGQAVHSAAARVPVYEIKVEGEDVLAKF
ncbi:MAG TPA: Rieske (2Fe-2S) protein [Terriglobales bacterium]